MPGGFPLGLEICNGTSSGASATAVLASASANTLGSWVQLVASTGSDCCFLRVDIGGFNGAGPNGAVDIGVGAGGSEVVVISQLMVAHRDPNGAAQVDYFIPVSIPSGTRIAARCQCHAINDGTFVGVSWFDGAHTQVEGYAGVDSLGFTAASTQGTTIDPGATAGTKGAYAQLTASTTRDYAGLFFAFDALNVTTGTTNNTDGFEIDVAIGAAASEVIIVPDIHVLKEYMSTVVGFQPKCSEIFWAPIPSGTRVAVRCQCSTNTATERLLGVTAYGIYQ